MGPVFRRELHGARHTIHSLTFVDVSAPDGMSHPLDGALTDRAKSVARFEVGGGFIRRAILAACWILWMNEILHHLRNPGMMMFL